MRIDREALARALKRLRPAAGRQAMVLVSPMDGEIRLWACSESESAEVVIPSPGQTIGQQVAYPLAELERVAALPGPTVEISTPASGRTKATVGRSVVTLHPAEPEVMLPRRKLARVACSIRIDSSDLLAAVGTVTPCVSQDDARIGLNGFHAESVEDMLRFVATDGHRMAWRDVPAAVEGGLPQRMLWPRDTARMLAGLEGALVIETDGRMVVVRSAGVTVELSLIDGDFPEYRAIIPDHFKHVVTGRRSAFVAAFRRAAEYAAASGRGGTVVTRVSFGSMSAEIEVLGLYSETFECSADVPVTFGVNARYAADALAIGPEEVDWRVAGPLAPMLTSPTAVVMPMRLE